MKKFFLSVALLGCFVGAQAVSAELVAVKEPERDPGQETSGYSEEEARELIAFRESLRGKTPEEMNVAVWDFVKERAKNKEARKEKMRVDLAERLQKRLVGNKRLTFAQKDDFVQSVFTESGQVSTFNDKLRDEDLDFFEKIANNPSLPLEEKKKAVKKRFSERRDKEQAARSGKLHRDRVAFLLEGLAGNNALTKAQKDELANLMDKEFRQDVMFGSKEHDKNTAFFEKIAGDAGLTQEAKKKAIKEYFKRLYQGKVRRTGR